MVDQVVLQWPCALVVAQQAHTRWQAQSRAPLAQLGLMVQQVVYQWAPALAAVQ